MFDEKISQALHAYVSNEYRVNVVKEFTRIPVTSEWIMTISDRFERKK